MVKSLHILEHAAPSRSDTVLGGAPSRGGLEEPGLAGAQPMIPTKSGPLVLCYHAVSETWEHSLSVRPVTFERQLRSLLRRGFRGVSASDVLNGEGRTLHVTFDDAYKSVAAALPVLERLGVPSTVFASTAYAEIGRPLDVPELAEQAAAHPEELATMDWDELRALSERGVEIGSHTVSHPHLPRLSDAEIDRELQDSRARIEDELGRPCRFLAYPFGEHDARVRAGAERAGYEAAHSLASQTARDEASRFALPRIDLYRRDAVLVTTLKTSMLRRPVETALRFFRRRGTS
jgi:peptidoglycan/xylan/chitin deacetylase (PgdA/CDA1 family)